VSYSFVYVNWFRYAIIKFNSDLCIFMYTLMFLKLGYKIQLYSYFLVVIFTYNSGGKI